MKINCISPNHKDSKPSLHVYEDGCFCFSCGFTCKVEEVLNADEIKELKARPKEKEDIKETIEYIETLPQLQIRGLSLHSNSNGYYIVWPDKSYYKKRIPDERSRYVGPKGHKPTLFRCRSNNSNNKTLIITEGELNALSLDLTIGGRSRVDIVSPGSASSLSGFINDYMRYNRVFIFVDKDPAGVTNGLELKKLLLSKDKRVTLIALEKDFNQSLQDGGPEAVKAQLMKELGLA